MYEELETPRPGIVSIRVNGTLSEDDDRTLVPWLETETECHGTMRVLVLQREDGGGSGLANVSEKSVSGAQRGTS